MSDPLAIQSSFHSRATLLLNSTKYRESFTRDDYVQFQRQMTVLEQYWRDHRVEIDALYNKLLARRSPYAPILPFYEMIRDYSAASSLAKSAMAF